MRKHKIKQRTELWHEMQKSSRIAGSTCFKAIGIGLLHEAQEHFDEFILKKSRTMPSIELQQKLNHGIANEIHRISTVASVLMPSLLPGCMTLTEDGCKIFNMEVLFQMY